MHLGFNCKIKQSKNHKKEKWVGEKKYVNLFGVQGGKLKCSNKNYYT
jgi:hypothetical protein